MTRDTRSDKEIVLAHFPQAKCLAVTGRWYGTLDAPKEGERVTHWRVFGSPEDRRQPLGSSGTTATAWKTAAQDIWWADRQRRRNVERRAALEAFDSQWSPPAMESFRATAQAFLDCERARHELRPGDEVHLDLNDLWEWLTEKRTVGSGG